MIIVIISVCQFVVTASMVPNLANGVSVGHLEIEMKRRRNDFVKRKKLDPLVANGVKYVSFKDVQFLSKFITERGKILPRRLTGCSARSQRLITRAIKQARNIGLL